MSQSARYQRLCKANCRQIEKWMSLSRTQSANQDLAFCDRKRTMDSIACHNK
jgi:hypothetical protein